MDKITKKTIAFDNDTVAYVLYMYLDSIDRLIDNMDYYLSKIGSGWKRENKRAYHNVAVAGKVLRQHIDIANQIIYKVGAEPYDELMKNSLWLLRMNLLIMDRVGADDKLKEELEEKLKSYKSSRYVSQSRIDSFKLREL